MDPSRRPIVIKKKIVKAAQHGGAWKVAYADFVTAMMALFIVLWLLSSNEKIRQAVGGYFRDPIGRGTNPGTNMTGTGRDLSVLKEDMSGLKEKLQSALKLIPHFEQLKGNVEFTITEEGLRIELIENSKGIFFENGNPEPSPIGVEILTALAKQLGRIPNRILIEGHTDAVPYDQSAVYGNWELSADRANAARRLMETQGLTPGQVLQIRGYADQDLRDKEHPEDPANRRVTLIVKYMDQGDAARAIKLGAAADQVKTLDQHPVENPASKTEVAPVVMPPKANAPPASQAAPTKGGATAIAPPKTAVVNPAKPPQSAPAKPAGGFLQSLKSLLTSGRTVKPSEVKKK